MHKICFVAAFCLCLCVTGLAQQDAADAPATKQDVDRYLETVHAHEMMRQVADALSAPMHKMVHEQYLRDQAKLPPDFETRMNAIMDDMFKNMPWDEMIDAMIPAYQRHFTKGEIDALIAFYGTPTGQKILKEMPAVTAEAMDTMMPIMRRRIDAMTQKIHEQAAEMARESQRKATPVTRD